ncbi:hypothetical protein CSKR_106415, partial [Clonorchis sinensis]
AQSPSFHQPYVLLEPKLDCFREIHSFAYQFGFCERLTWNPAESPVCDVSRQLNVLHQAASCSSCYDIRDIVIHLQTVEQGSKTLICISFTKLNIHLLLERVSRNFSVYSLTVTQMQANATERLRQFRNRSHFSRDAKWIYEKTYYSHASSVVSTVTLQTVELLRAQKQDSAGFQNAASKSPSSGSPNLQSLNASTLPVFHRLLLSPREARWLKWLERESTDRKVRGSNPTSASRLPLSRLGQPGSIPALELPSGGVAVRHGKGVTGERYLFFIYILFSARHWFAPTRLCLDKDRICSLFSERIGPKKDSVLLCLPFKEFTTVCLITTA